jgi:hypothetical protein
VVQKKLKCSQVDYELLKEARYEYNKTRDKIEKIEKEIEDLTQTPPIEAQEFSIRVRDMELQRLNRNKKDLNELLQELETNCFGSEE